MKAGPPYRHPEAEHGPCYVLDPEAWNRGERVVLQVLPAKNSNSRVTSEPQKRTPEATQLRKIVQWPKGRPLEWELAKVPEKRSEPAWAARARTLRAAGWSIRRIMDELGVKNRQLTDKVLAG